MYTTVIKIKYTGRDKKFDKKSLYLYYYITYFIKFLNEINLFLLNNIR